MCVNWLIELALHNPIRSKQLYHAAMLLYHRLLSCWCLETVQKLAKSTATDLLLNNRTWESQGPKKFNVLAAAGLNVNTGAKTLKEVFSENLVLQRRQYLPRSSTNFTSSGLSCICHYWGNWSYWNCSMWKIGTVFIFLTESSTVYSRTERYCMLLT